MQLTPEQLEKLNQKNGAGTRDEALQRPDRKPHLKDPSTHPPIHPSTPEEETPGTIAPTPIQATQAEESASKTLDLAMQSKVEGLNQAAERGANQATEEVLTEFTAYANVLLQGTEAASAAKAALREGLNQSGTAGTVARDFTHFFKLNAPASRALGDKHS